MPLRTVMTRIGGSGVQLAERGIDIVRTLQTDSDMSINVTAPAFQDIIISDAIGMETSQVISVIFSAVIHAPSPVILTLATDLIKNGSVIETDIYSIERPVPPIGDVPLANNFLFMLQESGQYQFRCRGNTDFNPFHIHRIRYMFLIFDQISTLLIPP